MAHEDAVVEWVEGNLISKLTMKFPCVCLVGERARGEVLSIAFAGDGEHQDAGAKVFHIALNTTRRIIAKSISKGRGRSSYRGWIKVFCSRAPNAARPTWRAKITLCHIP